MNKKIGFIGCGNMSKAIIGGIKSSNISHELDIIASARDIKKLEQTKAEYKIDITLDNKEIAEKSDIIFLGVKPDMYEKIIEEIRGVISLESIIVTMAPGKTLSKIEECFKKGVKILRTMPNTPSLVSSGVTAICPNSKIDVDELNLLKKILGTFSLVEEIEDKHFDAVVAVSGSSPAYVFMFIEAMADAAVMQGLPRDKAYKFAAQSVMGSAKMVLETGKHPGELKDMVCSPGGTTIEAVATLEKNGLRNAVIEAMKACGQKAGKM